MAADGTVSAARRTSTCSRAFTNWFGKSAPSALSKMALQRNVPVFGSIWLSMVRRRPVASFVVLSRLHASTGKLRSEEHTSELQSRFDLVCRLLLDKKNN